MLNLRYNMLNYAEFVLNIQLYFSTFVLNIQQYFSTKPHISAQNHRSAFQQ